MKKWIAAFALFGGLQAHASFIVNCTEDDSDLKWIKLSIENWKSGNPQDGVVVHSMKEARARIQKAFDEGLVTLMGEHDITRVMVSPRVAAILRPKQPHIPTACVIFKGDFLVK